jgi:tetratricopeptide (TPR) repeat protein
MSPQKQAYEDVHIKFKRKAVTQFKAAIAGIGLLTLLILLGIFSMPGSTFAAGNAGQVNQRATLPPEWTATFTALPATAVVQTPQSTITLGGQSSTAVPLNLTGSEFAGKQVIVDVDFLILHTGASEDESIIESAPRGTVKTIIADAQNKTDGTTWWYIGDGYGWVPSTQNGVPTTRDYSPDTLNQMLKETDAKLQSDAQNPILAFQEGWIHNNQHNYDAAVSEINSAIDMLNNNPNSDQKQLAHFYDYLGKVYLDQQDYRNTLIEVNEAIRLGLFEAAVYDRRAIAYQYLRQYPQSRADFEKAIRLDPRYGLLYSNLGALLSAVQKQDPEQLDYYNKAIEVDPYFPYGYSNRAIFFIGLGDITDHVVADLTMNLQLAPHDRAGLYNRGYVYWQRQEFTKALADFDALVQFYPDYAAGYSDRGALYSDMGDREAALKDLLMSIKIGDSTGLAYYNFGVVLHQEGQYAAALYCYNKALQINSYRNDARINRANLLEHFPELDEKTIMSAPNVESLITSP